MLSNGNFSPSFDFFVKYLLKVIEEGEDYDTFNFLSKSPAICTISPRTA